VLSKGLFPGLPTASLGTSPGAIYRPPTASPGASPGAFYRLLTASLGANSQLLPCDSKSPGLVATMEPKRHKSDENNDQVRRTLAKIFGPETPSQ
jgi:hypothetical protein